VGTFGLGIKRMLVKDIQIAHMNGIIRNINSKIIAGVEKSHPSVDSLRL
jgi:hypothetical protein